LHKLGLSVIGQCFYYRANAKILTMLIADEELKSEYSVEQLADHITGVMLAAIGAGPSLSARSTGRHRSGSGSTSIARNR
jgi:hypothetical protein